MRKTSLGLAVTMGFLTLSASSVMAQTKWMGGPFVGLNYTTVSGSDVSNTGYRAGVAAGGQLQGDFTGGMFLRMAALYSMRGATASEEGTDVKLKENFVEFPVMLGYSFASAGSTVKPFVMAGGQVGFKVSCEAEGEDSGTKVTLQCSDFTDDVAAVDYGAVGGGGVLFPAAGGTMSVDARYYLGLHDIGKNSDTKHRGFTVGIAYMIPFGH
jgi:hypothetical protein